MAGALEVVSVALAALGAVDSMGSLRRQARAGRFDKRVIKRARAVLTEQATLERRRAARLLGDPAFAAFAADPTNLARRRALSVPLGLVGPGSDVDRALDVLAEVWIEAASGEATPAERLLAGVLERIEDTTIQNMDIGLDVYAELERVAAALDHRLDRVHEALERLDRRRATDLVDVLDDDPFVAQDVDLSRFRMGSDVTDGAVPPYIARDIDPELDETLAAALRRSHERCVAVAGNTKTGKSRCLLEALSRVAPLHLVFPVRNAKGRDTVGELVKTFADNPPEQPWLVLVENLYEHLLGGMNLRAAMERAESAELPGCIVATTSMQAIDPTDAQRQTDRLSHRDLDLVAAHHITLSPEMSLAEQQRAQSDLAPELAAGTITNDDLKHLPERLAAIPQLLRRVDQVFDGLPSTSPEVALTLAACQLSLGQATRRLNLVELRERTVCVHRYLSQRRLGALTDRQFEAAKDWAGEPIGAAYAVLAPAHGTDDDVELLDAVVDHVGYHALNSDLRPCLDGRSRELLQLGAAAFTRYGDIDIAMHWTTEATRLDDPSVSNTASANLGLLFAERGDVAEAERWYRRAATEGHAGAMINLGLLLKGRGGHDDLAEAERWYRHAADEGDADAMTNLGTLYAERGDVAEAERWWRTGAAQGQAAAMFQLGILVQQRGDVAEAEDWYRRAAEQGHAEAMSNLGALYAERGDVAEAERWWGTGAAQGQAAAMFNLGLLFDTRGGDDNLAEAEGWYRRAADQGHAAAMYNLGVLLQQRGDVAQAEEWYRRAAELGHAGAMSNLGVLLQQRGGGDNLAEAEQWYRRAVDQNHAGALFNLGILLAERGESGEAEEWFQRAAESGDPEVGSRAQAALARMRPG